MASFTVFSISILLRWAPKNGCFWTVVLEKTLESPLDCKEIQPVHSEGDQSWIFIGRNDAETEAPILWPPDAQYWHLKRPWFWERLEAGGAGDNRGWDGWMASLTQWTWLWASLGVGDRQGGLTGCSPWCHQVGHYWATVKQLSSSSSRSRATEKNY